MKALVLDAQKQLSLTDVPKPEPKPGEVRVRIRAAALNHRDLWIQKGLYPGMQLPCILGADGAGIVDAVGDGVDSDRIGTEVVLYPARAWGDNPELPGKNFRVLGMPDPGTFAEFICVPADDALPKPAHLSWTEAAAFPLTGLTAYRALGQANVESNTAKILITGIGGGVATAGLLQSLGNPIYVTSSKPAKITAAVEMGAQGGVNYRDDDWEHQLKAMSGGIDVVLDGSPAADFGRYLRFLNRGAHVVCYGATGSGKTTVPLGKFFLKYISLIGSTMGSPADFRSLLLMMNDAEMRPLVSEVFAFGDFRDAFDTMARGKQMGKIVLVA